MMKNIIITYTEKGTMIVKHPSGHVDEYDKEHLTKIKKYFIRNREKIDKLINSVKEDISKL